MLTLVFLLTSYFASLVAGNAEKVIFIAPAAVTIPTTKPTLSDLNLLTLSPNASSIRTSLSRVFPNDEVAGQEKGESTWLLLDSLTQGQRYELRVCWSAVEPTEFTMDVYELDHVWATPGLMVSLANYAYANMPEPNFQTEGQNKDETKSAQQERTAHQSSLMKDPPPVLVDLILDPYVLNVLPRSLIPTAGYIIAVAVSTWFFARWITASLQDVANEPSSDPKKTE